MSDLWSPVREAVRKVLDERRRDLPYEERVTIAEHAGREVVEQVEWVDRRLGNEPTGEEQR